MSEEEKRKALPEMEVESLDEKEASKEVGTRIRECSTIKIGMAKKAGKSRGGIGREELRYPLKKGYTLNGRGSVRRCV